MQPQPITSRPKIFMENLRGLIVPESLMPNIIERISGLLAKATATPWFIGFADGSGADDGIYITHESKFPLRDGDRDSVIRGGSPEGDIQYGVLREQDAQLITELRNAASALMDVVKAAKAIVDLRPGQTLDLDELRSKLAALEGGE